MNTALPLTGNDAAQAPALPADTQWRHGFVFDGQRLVPGAGVLTELLADAVVYPVPRTPAVVVGTLNLRGTLVPVFDPRRSLQVATDLQPRPQRVLVFGQGDARVALVLAATPELVALRPGAPGLPPPPGCLSPWLGQAWCSADDPSAHWWELDHQAAFMALARAASPDADLSLSPAGPYPA